MYLVHFVDELIETLERNPEYQRFLFDGQVAAVIDYMEIRPKQKDRLSKLICEQRISVGPWYTLPDLYPINGESMIRNLLKGMLEAEKLGDCLKIGYESFGWGQPSQLPQIYKGFGIDTVIVSKNVDRSRAPHCEFQWEGADGTTVYATRLGEDARANFFMNVYLEIMSGKAYKSDSYRYIPGVDGQIYHQADEDGSIQDYFKLENTEYIHKEKVKESIKKAWHAMDDTVLPDERPMMDGSDSTTAQPQLVTLLEELNAQSEDIVFLSSSLEEYVERMKDKLPWEDLPIIKGEMRDGPTTSLSGNALMTRPYIKTLNKKVQNILFYGAEPFSVVSMLLGNYYDEEFLEKAKNYMLLSHAHDSINGVTQDKTVEDVMYRLNQSFEIANVIYNDCCQHILCQLDTSEYAKSDVLLAVFNPYPKARREIVKVYIDTPAEENIWEFQIENARGERCEIQALSREEKTVPVVHLQARPFPMYVDRHCIFLETKEIPAGGYIMYKVCEPVHFNRKTEFWAKTRTTMGNELAHSPTEMENAYMKVMVNADGSINLQDKRNKEAYQNLNYYESTGDVGDYWMYYPPYRNKTFTSKGMTADIWLEENGPLSATIGVKIAFKLPTNGQRPQNYIRGRSERSKQMKVLPITTYYNLKKDARQVEVRVEVEQCIEDHKLSVLFDSQVDGAMVDAEGHFTVDTRNIVPLRDSKGEYYNELTTQPMQKFLSYTKDGRGLGILTDTLGEYEVRNQSNGTMAFTLLRAVKNIICTEWRSAGEFSNQNGGQSMQLLSYHYAIMPMQSNWAKSEIIKRSEKFNTPVKAVQTCRAKQAAGTLPSVYSFYEVKGDLSLSCFKKAERSKNLIMRLYNEYDRAAAGAILLAYPIKNAYETNLLEERIRKIPITGSYQVDLHIEANKIITVEIELRTKIGE